MYSVVECKMLLLQNFQVTFERELSMICGGFPFIEPNTASRISYLLGYGVDPNIIAHDVRNINVASWNII